MTLADWLGHAAGFCTTSAFVPQVLKVWRTRSVQDISVGMYVVFVFGLALWLAYGIVLRACQSSSPMRSRSCCQAACW